MKQSFYDWVYKQNRLIYIANSFISQNKVVYIKDLLLIGLGKLLQKQASILITPSPLRY